MTILRYTGYPFVDGGVATIVAAAGVDRPEDVTPDHIDGFVQEVIDIYMRPGVAGHLSRNVFANAGFANPAQINNPQYDTARRNLLRTLLSLWKTGTAIPPKMVPASSDDVCAFSGDRAVVRTSRMYIPMITGESDINFLPEGRPGLPISGWCLLAILVMPLGTLKCGKRLIAVHGSDHQIVQYFAARNLERNRMALHIQHLDSLPVYSFAKTYLIEDLLHAQSYPRRGSSLTAYQFDSDAQDASVRLYHLPSSVLSFVQIARHDCTDAWNFIVRRAQFTQPDAERIEGKKSAAGQGDGAVKQVQVYGRRNSLYEDLFDLPHNARLFLRRYLLRVPTRPKGGKVAGDDKFDPRFGYSYLGERQAVSWPLAELFLERIMRMDRQRIDKIRTMGDALAGYIQDQDRRLFRELFTARSEYHVRLALLKAANVASGVLVPYDDFVDVFFVDSGETMRSDWSLARDLLMVRIIERLHDTQWLEQNQDLVDETNKEIVDAAQTQD